MAGLDALTLGQRIRDARVRADLTQDDLGGAIGLDRTAVAKIEAGKRRLTALELSDLAAALGVRMVTFFEDPVPALVSHRASQGQDVADSQIDGHLARLAGEVEFVVSLGAWGAGGAALLPEHGFDAPSSMGAAESLAGEARSLAGLAPDEPVIDLPGVVSRVGLLAFSRDIGKDTADAGTILLPRGGVSLVNSFMKVGRRRLALAHELGHYLVQDDYSVDWRVGEQSGDDLLESRLDRFARAFLLPEGAVAATWSALVARSDERVAAVTLASEFRVDMATLATRVRELRLADADVVSAIRGYRTTQADMIELELFAPPEELQGTSVPRAFAQGVIALVRQQRISHERALDLLQGTLSEEDLPSPRRRHESEIWQYVS